MIVLIVDDNETDRKVLRKILERESHQALEAEDGVEALTLLERERVDVVISDVIMPNMDGLQFCYELRQGHSQRRIPVVVYTNHFSNENMADLARDFGADFCLKKPSPPAQILEALRKAREARSQPAAHSPVKLPDLYRDKKTYSEWLIRKLEDQNVALELSEARYRRLVELSPDGVAVVCEGLLVFINGAGARILGAASPRDIEGRPVMDFVHPDFKDIALKRTSDLLQGKLNRNPPMEQRLVRVHGGFVDAETMSASFRYMEKPAVLVLVRDVTERKRAESKIRESERLIQESQQAAFIGSYRYDFVGDRWESTEVMDRIFGIGPSYPHSAQGWLDLIHPGDREMMANYFKEEVQAKRQSFEKEYRIIRKSDGQVRWVYGLGRLSFAADGGLVSMVGTIQDVTDRKTAEEKLREKERDLRMAQQVAHIGSWTIDLAGPGGLEKNPLSWSDQVFRILGYEPGRIEVSRENFFKGVPPQDRPVIDRALAAAVAEGTPCSIDHRVVRPDGETRVVHQQAEVVRDERTGKPLKLVGTIQDITERKRVEDALRENERFLSTLVSNLPGIVYRCRNDKDWTMEYISGGVQSLTGYSVSDFLSMRVTYESIIHPEDRERVWEGIQNALAELRPFQLLYRVRTAAGDVRWFWEQGQGVLREGEHFLSLEGFITDVTDRQRFEMALKRSEANYRTLMEQAADAILIADPQGNYIDANASACELFGFSKEELVSKKLGDLSDPAEPPVLSMLLGMRPGESHVTERKFRRKDGTLLVIEVHGKKLPDGRIQGVYHDVTKRKKAEEELRRSEANYRMLMDQASDAILIADAAGNYIDANNRTCELLGYSREEIRQKRVGDLSDPSEAEHGWAILSRVGPGQMDFRERRFRRKDGTVLVAETSAKQLMDGRFQVILRDITERKRAEESLKGQQAFIQKLADLLPAIVYVFDLIERKPVYANRAAAGILGYDPEELQAMGPGFIRQVMHPDDALLYQQRFGRFASAGDGDAVENEYRLRNKDGSWRRFQCQETVFSRDPDGRPRLILGIARETN